MKLDGAKLITARHRKGMNQSEVAAACDLNETTVCKAENGGDIRVSTGKRLCEFLGLDLAELVIPAGESKGDAA